MCGILVHVTGASQSTNDDSSPETQELQDWVRRRGPDHCGHANIGPVGNSERRVSFFASVLHLRSQHVVKQPVVSPRGNILVFNGELYAGLPGLEADPDASDTTLLSQALEDAADSSEEIAKTLASIYGEFAFAFYHAATSTLWFGRDRLGRRSLLWKRGQNTLDLVSVATRGHGWGEVGTEGLYCLDLKDPGEDGLRFTLHRWYAETSMPTGFKEGLTLLNHGPIRQALIDNMSEDRIPWPPTAKLEDVAPHLVATVDSFERTLRTAVKRRVWNISNNGADPSLAILFSGGVDCTVLAALAATELREGQIIDLINVAFENPRSLNAKAAAQKKQSLTADVSENDKYNVPDRVTARQSYERLCTTLPQARFRLVEINVPFDEAMAYRDRILDLMSPSSTVMDLSIAMAFWFAVRGVGTTAHSTAKVLLTGLGADELLGGYSRHRAKFYEGDGWQALADELQLDYDRLPQRNLGRDDRIIGDHGKEVRLPFLDEDVIKLCASIPVHERCDPRLQQGTGDKLLIRLLAHRLQLGETAIFKKRAIQFGARTAKMNVGEGGIRGDAAVE